MSRQCSHKCKFDLEREFLEKESHRNMFLLGYTRLRLCSALRTGLNHIQLAGMQLPSTPNWHLRIVAAMGGTMGDVPFYLTNPAFLSAGLLRINNSPRRSARLTPDDVRCNNFPTSVPLNPYSRIAR